MKAVADHCAARWSCAKTGHTQLNAAGAVAERVVSAPAAAMRQSTIKVCYAGITFKEANFHSLLCSLQDFTQRPSCPGWVDWLGPSVPHKRHTLRPPSVAVGAIVSRVSNS